MWRGKTGQQAGRRVGKICPCVWAHSGSTGHIFYQGKNSGPGLHFPRWLTNGWNHFYRITDLVSGTISRHENTPEKGSVSLFTIQVFNMHISRRVHFEFRGFSQSALHPNWPQWNVRQQWQTPGNTKSLDWLHFHFAQCLIYFISINIIYLLCFTAHKLKRAASAVESASRRQPDTQRKCFHLWQQDHTAVTEYFNKNPLVRNSRGTKWLFFTTFSFRLLPSDQIKSEHYTFQNGASGFLSISVGIQDCIV